MQKIIFLFTLSILLISCSKTTYSIKQAFGQMSLEMRGRENKDILADKNVDEKIKDKIKLVEKYKKYFYDYFDMKQTPIYDETTILDSKAVSYLVIASPIDRVEPVKHSFPFAGTFPYLGFFEQKDALQFKKELSVKYFTYVRPVYAYSTLNQLFFYDNILSSFFEYDDYRLAEIIFHELTHTVFFVKGDVDFNESLAQYIGEELAQDYFHLEDKQRQNRKLKAQQNQEFQRIISEFVNEYNEKLKLGKPNTKEEATLIMQKLYVDKYQLIYQQECQRQKRKKCQWNIAEWNNARMAEFLTYQSKQSLVKQVREKKGMSLKELLKYLIVKHDQYGHSSDKDFTTYLKKEEHI